MTNKLTGTNMKQKMFKLNICSNRNFRPEYGRSGNPLVQRPISQDVELVTFIAKSRNNSGMKMLEYLGKVKKFEVYIKRIEDDTCPECNTPDDEITGCETCHRPTSHEDEPEP